MRCFNAVLSIAVALLGWAGWGTPIAAQSARPLGLEDAIQLARNQSIAARRAATTKETRYWEYRSFRSNYKPQLVLSGDLPAFTRAFQEVRQPNGTVLFQPVRNNNSASLLFFAEAFKRIGIDCSGAMPHSSFNNAVSFSGHSLLPVHK